MTDIVHKDLYARTEQNALDINSLKIIAGQNQKHIQDLTGLIEKTNEIQSQHLTENKFLVEKVESNGEICEKAKTVIDRCNEKQEDQKEKKGKWLDLRVMVFGTIIIAILGWFGMHVTAKLSQMFNAVQKISAPIAENDDLDTE